MTDLRTAAQQALEALERLQNAIYNIGGEHVTGLYVANDAADSAEKPMGALRAALAQQAEQQEPCEPLEVLKRALEIIAVGDSKNPQQDAADALIDIGFWSGEGAAR